jgi:hypothetical protein
VHFGFAATLGAPAHCGLPFQLCCAVTRLGDAVVTGSCAVTRLHAPAPPAIQGIPSAGRTLIAVPPGLERRAGARLVPLAALLDAGVLGDPRRDETPSEAHRA